MAPLLVAPGRVLSWNAKISRQPSEVMLGLANLIANTKPEVICLQECTQYTDEIRSRFGDQWYVYAQNDWHEANECPVMVSKRGHTRRKRGHGRGWDTLDTKIRWTGPEGGVHKGRTWTYVKVGGVWVMSLHRATDLDGKNRKACAEEHDRLVQWIGNHQPCLVIGDHNCSARADFPGASSKVAEHSRSTLAFESGAGLVDYAIQHGTQGEIRVKDKHGSDHAAVLWVKK